MLNRHRRLSRRCARRSFGPRRLTRARCRATRSRSSVVNRLKVGDAAAGHAQGPHRRGQPVALKKIGVNLSRTGRHWRVSVRHRPGHPERQLVGSPIRTLPAGVAAVQQRRRRHHARPVRKLLGLDLLGSLDLAQTDGLVTTLAEPTLTALVGRNRELPCRRRVPDPGLAGQSARSASSTSSTASAWRSRRSSSPTAASRCASGRKSASCPMPARSPRRLQGPGADHPPRRNDGRARLRPVVHDRWPASEPHNNSVHKAPFLGDLPILGDPVPVDQLTSATKPSW